MAAFYLRYRGNNHDISSLSCIVGLSQTRGDGNCIKSAGIQYWYILVLVSCQEGVNAGIFWPLSDLTITSLTG
jgi:hypothetical protein